MIKRQLILIFFALTLTATIIYGLIQLRTILAPWQSRLTRTSTTTSQNTPPSPVFNGNNDSGFVPPKNWIYYLNNSYNFSFRSPSDYTINESTYNPSENLTITISGKESKNNNQSAELFKIYVYKSLSDLPAVGQKIENIGDYIVAYQKTNQTNSFETTSLAGSTAFWTNTGKKEIYFLQMKKGILGIDVDENSPIYSATLVSNILGTLKDNG